MANNAFIDSVATLLGTSSEQATSLTRATLTTLAERIDPGEARDLSARLPAELAPYAFGPNQAAEQFGLDEFVSRVGGRAEADGAQARDAVVAVLVTLRETIPPGEYDDVIAHLPMEFWDISGTAGRYDRPGGG
ncbi:MAG TPA: DUF2267 domain-containing protein [Micromonosporaceae bacterium]